MDHMDVVAGCQEKPDARPVPGAPVSLPKAYGAFLISATTFALARRAFASGYCNFEGIWATDEDSRDKVSPVCWLRIFWPNRNVAVASKLWIIMQ